MASEQGNGEDQVEASHEPRECMACRGSGRVISHLGGTVSTVTCPWCEGRGQRLSDVDAQANWRGEEPQTQAPGEDPDAAA
jgi:DnaJ-class molecular chaperone